MSSLGNENVLTDPERKVCGDVMCPSTEDGRRRIGRPDQGPESGDEFGREEISRYSHYLMTLLVLTFLLALIGYLNGYLHFVNVAAYYSYERSVLSPLRGTGYLTMFLVLCFFPVTDYVLIPFYGYMTSLGYFNGYPALLTIVGSMMFVAEIEYLGGRFAGRPILLRALSYFNIEEKDIESADRWLTRHGPFSIFISTFVPYFRNVASLAAGVLRMNAVYYTITSLAGYSVRAVLLFYFGYLGMDVLTPSFDYGHRLQLLTVAVSAALLIAALGLARRYS